MVGDWCEFVYVELDCWEILFGLNVMDKLFMVGGVLCKWLRFNYFIYFRVKC